jgi:hypothetical protein
MRLLKIGNSEMSQEWILRGNQKRFARINYESRPIVTSKNGLEVNQPLIVHAVP